MRQSKYIFGKHIFIDPGKMSFFSMMDDKVQLCSEGHRRPRMGSVPNFVGYNCLRESKAADLESVPPAGNQLRWLQLRWLQLRWLQLASQGKDSVSTPSTPVFHYA